MQSDNLAKEAAAILAQLEQQIDFESLPGRIAALLERNKIKSFADLCKITEAQLAMKPGFGTVAINTICGFLHERGLHLGMDIDAIIRAQPWEKR